MSYDEEEYNYMIAEANRNIKAKKNELYFLQDEINHIYESNQYLLDQIKTQKEELYHYQNQIKNLQQNSSANSYINETRSESDLLLNGNASNRTQRMNDLSFNFIHDNDSVNNILQKETLIESNKREEEINKLNEEEDNELIFQQILIMLNDLNNSISNVEKAENQNLKDGRLSLVCDSILIIAYQDNDGTPEFLLQTFRIDNKTKFQNLCEIIINFWSFKDDEQNYNLYILEGNNASPIDLYDDKNNIDAFLKSRSSLQKAQFIFISKSINLDKDIISTFRLKESEYSSNKKKKSSEILSISPPIESFFNLFSGLTYFIKDIYLKTKLEKNKREIIKQPKMKKNEEKNNLIKEIIDKFLKFLHIIFLILFAIFSLISVVGKEGESKAYEIRKKAYEIFNYAETDNHFDLSDVVNIFEKFNRTSNNSFYEYILLTPLRFNFYWYENCKKYFIKELNSSICIQEILDLNYTYFSNGYDIVLGEIEKDTQLDEIIKTMEINGFNNIKNSTNNNNIVPVNYLFSSDVTAKKKLMFYYKTIFNEKAYENKQDYFYINGMINDYEGRTFYFTINPFLVNRNLLNYTLNKILPRSRIDLFSSIIVTFTLYNPNFDIYYYVTILYEINSGIIVNRAIMIDLFQLNIYYNLNTNTYNTKSIFCDTFRFIITIIFVLFYIRDYLIELRSLKENESSLMILLNPSLIIDIFIIVIYFMRYGLKTYYSFLIKKYDLLIDFQEKFYSSTDTDYFYRQKYFELYEIKDFFVNDAVYDLFLFFISYVRFISFLVNFPKIKNFLTLVYDAMIKISYYFVFLFIILFAFSLFSNNLYGEDDVKFQNIFTSFTYILLLCNGHNSIFRNRNKFQTWDLIFVVMFFLIVIYFLQSVVFGIYLESFRIFSWRNGYSLNKNETNKDIFSKIKKYFCIKEETKNENNKINQDG